MPKVLIPPPYRGPTQGTGEVDVDGATALDCLEAVERKYPGFLAQGLDEDGNVHRYVKLFRNGDLLDREASLAQALDPGDELEVLAAIAGG